MTLRTWFEIFRSGYALGLTSLTLRLYPMYRILFDAGAGKAGLLRRLGDGPVPFDDLLAEFTTGEPDRVAFEGYLDFGVRIGELRKGRRGYSLRGRLARTLADPAMDPILAAVEEAAGPQVLFIAGAPERLRDGRRFELEEYDHALVERSSRLFEPFVREAVERVVPPTPPLRLLEIGCGSGIHIKHAADRNPGLRATAVEREPAVAEVARRNVESWGLAGRVEVVTSDVDDLAPSPDYDLVTLHNNINYRPVGERTEALRRLRRFCRPGGRLLVTVACRGGSQGMQLLDLWGAMTEGTGRLPDRAELVGQLESAGFEGVRSWNLAVIDAFYAFVGRNPAGAPGAS